MILYLDASALVKLYVSELGSVLVKDAISEADLVGTSVVGRAEAAAAFAKSVRMGILKDEALKCLQALRRDWPDLVKVQVTEIAINRADAYAWEYGLRGYDAVHLAAAVLWQETMGEPVTMATFDQALWEAAEKVGLEVYPLELPNLLKSAEGKKGRKR